MLYLYSAPLGPSCTPLRYTNMFLSHFSGIPQSDSRAGAVTKRSGSSHVPVPVLPQDIWAECDPCATYPQTYRRETVQV